MPIFSLPSDEGIGTFGRWAYRAADIMRGMGARVWQVLPLTTTGYGDSPYQSCCSYALNYYFIDLKTLRDEKLLTEEEISGADLSSVDLARVDYGKQFNSKISLLRTAFKYGGAVISNTKTTLWYELGSNTKLYYSLAYNGEVVDGEVTIIPSGYNVITIDDISFRITASDLGMSIRTVTSGASITCNSYDTMFAYVLAED